MTKDPDADYKFDGKVAETFVFSPLYTERVFYDLETDGEHPQYCNMTLCGALQQIYNEECDGWYEIAHVWEAPFTEEKLEEIRQVICKPDIQRIGFNNLNFDDLVLANLGVDVPEDGTEDAMLAIKTVCPGMPSHALKFLCWYLLGDLHWEQFELNQSGHRFEGGVVTDKLRAYHRKDLNQHRDIWDWIRERAYSETHLEAYKLDMAMKLPLKEMTFDGGTVVDVEKCKTTMDVLLAKKELIQAQVKIESGGQVKNANSNRQVGKYLALVEEFELNLTGTGEFQVKKKDLADITGMDDDTMRAWKPGMPLPENFSSVALLAWQMKDNETLRKYVKNYLAAADGTGMGGWIPNAYGISRAVTRRTLSKSFFKINFQNSTEAIDAFKLVPPGMLGWFIDSTQVENVVHIYESDDIARRQAYEEDEDWNEYVWLCNRILGTNKDKKELDSIKSKQVPHWSIYKLYKTVKLALNFGMGTRKFCKTLGLEQVVGKLLFGDIHRACPAIRQLQDKVEGCLQSQGYVQDSFGHIYTGPEEEAYKVVAYLIQGCGTGSLPKAQLRANYDTLHSWSQTLGVNVGPLCTTTHDENSGLLRLDLGEEVLTSILTDLMDNMTSKFSHKFGGIPLRAKLYLSIKNTADKKHHETKNYRSEIRFPAGCF